MFYHYNGNSLSKVEEILVNEKGKDSPEVAKLKWLQERWGSKKYLRIGEETSWMHSILFKKVEPIHAIIIADDITYFKLDYKHSPVGNWALFLNEACLCGSRNIAEYLLMVAKTSYQDHPELLPYISASNCVTWAKDVALILAQKKLSIPKDLYRFADGPTIDLVVKIFETENQRVDWSPTSGCFDIFGENRH